MLARMTLLALVVLVGVASGPATAAPAQAAHPEWERFEVTRAQGWPEALALCDLTRFLLSRPALDADVILTRDDNTGDFRPLYGPRFLPPNLLYDGELRRTFFRLQSEGETDRRSVGEARFRLDRAMFKAFRRGNVEQRLFLENQAETCSALTAQVRSRPR